MGNGWKFALKDLQGDGWGWMTWRQGEPGSGSHGVCPSHSEALKAAHDAIEAASPKPADPAWMVEVAREANAVGYDAAKMDGVAAAVRGGERDRDPETATAIRALRLALERGHVVERRPVPSEEEMLKAAREDAAQVFAAAGYTKLFCYNTRAGVEDRGTVVQAALQARRNMLREMDPDFREVGEPVSDWKQSPKPLGRNDTADAMAVSAIRSTGDVAIFYLEGNGCRVDLDAALKRAWDAGALFIRETTQRGIMAAGPRDRDVSSILSNLPAKE